MKPGKIKHLIALIDLLFVLYASVSLYHLSQKISLPTDIDFPVTVNGVLLNNGGEAEFYMNTCNPGKVLLIQEGGGIATREAVPFYSDIFIVYDAFIIFFIFSLGAYVYYSRQHNRASFIFHMATSTVATAIVGTKTLCAIMPTWIGYSMGVTFFILYTVTPIPFIHFTYVFPSEVKKRFFPFILSLYVAGIAIALWHAVLYIRAAGSDSVTLYQSAQVISMIQNGFLFLLLLLGIINFVISYSTTKSVIERKKLRWILFGLSTGPVPFLFLWVLPIALGESPIIPEFSFKLFLLLIPVTFTVAILRHRAMDIDLIINRSTVYAIVIGIVMLLYFSIVGIIVNVIAKFTFQTSMIISTLTAFTLALLFDPLRRRVQRFVDRSFFRIQYDFRQAQQKFIDEIKQCVHEQSLATLLVQRIDELIPLERIGFFIFTNRHRTKLLAHHNFDLLSSHGLPVDVEKLPTRLDVPIIPDSRIEPGVAHNPGDDILFKKWGITLVCPIALEHLDMLGFLVLGEKKSGLRFTAEDIGLLNTISSQSALTIERIDLQKKLLLEHAETQRLDELNKLKSYFVSSVSHDLKTPLTSIKMFAELLRTGKAVNKSTANEYLEIIEGESERLTRLINNVLDFSRIERGVKEYHFNDVELNAVVHHVIKVMNYRLKIENFKLNTSLCDKECYLNADVDALAEALVNLISNAIKYSHDTKEITIATFRNNGRVGLQVKDRGIGITADDIEHIFEPFYRAREAKTLGTGGAGLGLSIVKHIMDAHKGKIDIESAPGLGTTITLFFPLSLEI